MENRRRHRRRRGGRGARQPSQRRSRPPGDAGRGGTDRNARRAIVRVPLAMVTFMAPALAFLGGPRFMDWFVTERKPGLQGRRIACRAGAAPAAAQRQRPDLHPRPAEDFDHWRESATPAGATTTSCPISASWNVSNSSRSPLRPAPPPRRQAVWPKRSIRPTTAPTGRLERRAVRSVTRWRRCSWRRRRRRACRSTPTSTAPPRPAPAPTPYPARRRARHRRGRLRRSRAEQAEPSDRLRLPGDAGADGRRRAVGVEGCRRRAAGDPGAREVILSAGPSSRPIS